MSSCEGENYKNSEENEDSSQEQEFIENLFDFQNQSDDEDGIEKGTKNINICKKQKDLYKYNENQKINIKITKQRKNKQKYGEPIDIVTQQFELQQLFTNQNQVNVMQEVDTILDAHNQMKPLFWRPGGAIYNNPAIQKDGPNLILNVNLSSTEDKSRLSILSPAQSSNHTSERNINNYQHNNNTNNFNSINNFNSNNNINQNVQIENALNNNSNKFEEADEVTLGKQQQKLSFQKKNQKMLNDEIILDSNIEVSRTHKVFIFLSGCVPLVYLCIIVMFTTLLVSLKFSLINPSKEQIEAAKSIQNNYNSPIIQDIQVIKLGDSCAQGYTLQEELFTWAGTFPGCYCNQTVYKSDNCSLLAQQRNFSDCIEIQASQPQNINNWRGIQFCNSYTSEYVLQHISIDCPAAYRRCQRNYCVSNGTQCPTNTIIFSQQRDPSMEQQYANSFKIQIYNFVVYAFSSNQTYMNPFVKFQVNYGQPCYDEQLQGTRQIEQYELLNNSYKNCGTRGQNQINSQFSDKLQESIVLQDNIPKSVLNQLPDFFKSQQYVSQYMDLSAIRQFQLSDNIQCFQIDLDFQLIWNQDATRILEDSQNFDYWILSISSFSLIFFILIKWNEEIKCGECFKRHLRNNCLFNKKASRHIVHVLMLLQIILIIINFVNVFFKSNRLLQQTALTLSYKIVSENDCFTDPLLNMQIANINNQYVYQISLMLIGRNLMTYIACSLFLLAFIVLIVKIFVLRIQENRKNSKSNIHINNILQQKQIKQM